MSIFEELKRRNVFRVGIAYVVGAWLLIQVADVLLDAFDVPDWTMRLILVVLIVGFPVALFFAWVYELTPEGIKKESEVERSRSVTAQTGRKLDRAIIVVLAIALAYFAFDKFVLQKGEEPRQTEEQAEAPAPDESASPPDRSIAVLPFANMSADPENEYFADGLSEELLNQLAQVPDLMVAGRTSSFSFKGKNEDLRSIGATLGVAHVLEGSVRRQGSAVRITTQLIRVSDGFHLWSETYDRTMEDVFAIQDDISTSVARALRIVLDEKARNAMQAVGVRNVDAFVAYQKARELYAKAHGELPLLPTLAEANRYLEGALELVPDFGAAWWLMSDYYAHVLMDMTIERDEREQALRDLRHVMRSSTEHTRDATRRSFIAVDQVLFSDDWTTLRDRIEEALASTGCFDPTWIEIAAILGYAEAMAPMWDRHIRCEPQFFIGWTDRAAVDIMAGRMESGLGRVLDAKKRFGAHPIISTWHQRALLGLGRFEEAAALAPEIISEPEFFGWGAEVLPLAAQGKIPEARAALASWREQYGDAGDLVGHALFGEREAANRFAARLDAEPAGPLLLLTEANACSCGTPFDLDATPRLKARLNQAGIDWNPPSILEFPAKDW